MATATDTQISRRSAVALAAAVAATVATAVVTYGGLQHWQSQAGAQPAQVVQLAQLPAEESD